MDISYFNEFAVLMEIGNYSKAADKLSISQSVLSKHMKSMETELDVRLIKKNGRSITTSEYGRELLPFAKEIARMEMQYKEILNNKKHEIARSVNIGAFPGILHYGILQSISEFSRENPEINIDMYEGDNQELEEMLASGKIQIAIARTFPGTPTAEGFQNDVIREDEICVVLHKNHPLAGKEDLLMEELRYESFVMMPENTKMYEFCVNECKKAGFQPEIVYTSNNGNNLLEMVRQDIGIALMNRAPALNRNLTDLVLRNIKPKFYTYVSAFAKTQHDEIIDYLIDYIKKKEEQ